MLNLKEVLDSRSGQAIEKIPIDFIRPNPYQPRKTFVQTGLEELSESIKEYGVLQPISVRKTGKNTYELIAGERRLKASKIAGFKYIPCIVMNAVDQDSAIIALIENLQREDLHFLEEAEGYYNLLNDYNMTQQQLAKKVGKKQSTIANKLRILKLEEKIKEKIVEHNLTERHARALLKIPDSDLQEEIVNKIIEKNLNVKTTEELIDKTISRIYEKNKDSQNKRIVIRAYKDLRIFFNTIKKTVKIMKDAGLEAKYMQEDKGDFFEVIIKIPKSSVKNKKVKFY
ncbi:MAG: nucleoid occlusion protein [Clostridia bacterium]|nr:nucleoid occlusion protein [Clostridia bacterium]